MKNQQIETITNAELAYWVIGVIFVLIVITSPFLPYYLDSNSTGDVGFQDSIEYIFIFSLHLIWFSALILSVKCENKKTAVVHGFVIVLGILVVSYIIFNLTRAISFSSQTRTVSYIFDAVFFMIWCLLIWKTVRWIQYFRNKSSFQPHQ